jgi:hypothetical protein
MLQNRDSSIIDDPKQELHFPPWIVIEKAYFYDI